MTEDINFFKIVPGLHERLMAANNNYKNLITIIQKASTTQ
jgi:hypothetical protein